MTENDGLEARDDLDRLQQKYPERADLMAYVSTLWSMAFASAYCDEPDWDKRLEAAIHLMHVNSIEAIGMALESTPTIGKEFNLAVPDFQRFNKYANTIGIQAKVHRIDGSEASMEERRVLGVWEASETRQ